MSKSTKEDHPKVETRYPTTTSTHDPKDYLNSDLIDIKNVRVAHADNIFMSSFNGASVIVKNLLPNLRKPLNARITLERFGHKDPYHYFKEKFIKYLEYHNVELEAQETDDVSTLVTKNKLSNNHSTIDVCEITIEVRTKKKEDFEAYRQAIDKLFLTTMTELNSLVPLAFNKRTRRKLKQSRKRSENISRRNHHLGVDNNKINKKSASDDCGPRDRVIGSSLKPYIIDEATGTQDDPIDISDYEDFGERFVKPKRKLLSAYYLPEDFYEKRLSKKKK